MARRHQPPARPQQQPSRGKAPKRKKGKSRLPLVAVLIAVILIIFSGILPRGNEGGDNGDDSFNRFISTARPNYDWNCLYSDNGQYYYWQDEQVVSRFGIDVSDSQGYIDWNAVASDNVEFAIIRCGYRGYSNGSVHGDEYFEWNIDNATKAGINVGTYFYSQALTEDEAREEAEFCLQMLDGRQLHYPVAYDFEKTSDGDGRADELSADQISANAEAFCEVIEDAGYDTIIYGNQNDLDQFNSKLRKRHGIWYAEYGSIPSSGHDFALWQYSNTGSIYGIDTDVDLDIDLSHVH